MAYTTAGKHGMLAAFKANVTKVVLYDDYGVMIDEKKNIGWKDPGVDALNGEMVMSNNEIVFNVPAGTVVAEVGLETDLGTEWARSTVAEEKFVNAGTYTLIYVKVDLNAVPEE